MPHCILQSITTAASKKDRPAHPPKEQVGGGSLTTKRRRGTEVAPPLEPRSGLQVIAYTSNNIYTQPGKKDRGPQGGPPDDEDNGDDQRALFMVEGARDPYEHNGIPSGRSPPLASGHT